MNISQHFDGGNIEVIRAEKPSDIVLKIRPDSHSDFFQWFYFRLRGMAGVTCHITLADVDKSAFPEGWHNYRLCVSYDRQHWFRIATQYDGQHLLFEFTPRYQDVYFAYFAPYSYERHLDLLAWAQQSIDCEIVPLCQTVQQRDLDMLKIGQEAEHKKKIWLIARQHPGETMAQWFIEGLLEKLLTEDDPLARVLKNQAVFYIVPNMNPDGSVLGNLRTNAKGRNLNRQWHKPCPENSPEVYYVREKIAQTGVDVFLDIHGDEALEYNFVAGCEGVPSYNSKQASLESLFKSTLKQVSPDFQTEHGYPKTAPGQADLSLATHYVGHTYQCLAFTLEMPFKDNANLPDDIYGWSATRCKHLGQDMLHPIKVVLDHLESVL